jgi:hypothetical protein
MVDPLNNIHHQDNRIPALCEIWQKLNSSKHHNHEVYHGLEVKLMHLNHKTR